MISITRLNGKKLAVNADLVKFVEETPDTIITLRDGEKILVQESVERVIELVVEYARATRGPAAMARE